MRFTKEVSILQTGSWYAPQKASHLKPELGTLNQCSDFSELLNKHLDILLSWVSLRHLIFLWLWLFISFFPLGSQGGTCWPGNISECTRAEQLSEVLLLKNKRPMLLMLSCMFLNHICFENDSLPLTFRVPNCQSTFKMAASSFQFIVVFRSLRNDWWWSFSLIILNKMPWELRCCASRSPCSVCVSIWEHARRWLKYCVGSMNILCSSRKGNLLLRPLSTLRSFCS